AAWAGPNMWTACVAPLIVTLVIRTVAGLQMMFGVMTASRFECPWLWLTRAVANAVPTGPSFEPMRRSMWAISLPLPARASPMNMDMMRLLEVVRGVLGRCEGLYTVACRNAKEKLLLDGETGVRGQRPSSMHARSR